MLKFKKWKFCRLVPFEVLVIDKYCYGENIFPRDVKFYPCTGNSPTAYQPLSLAGSRTGRNCRAGQKNLFTPRLPTSVIFP
jgi:hypothetical protein